MGGQPSFLWIVTDQERYDMVGANGSAICRTPHLDRLAQQGVRFTAAFTPIGICTPARASLLTGLYPHAHGMWNNCHGPDALQRELPPEHVTFTELLKGGGYRLGYVGKWHVGYRLGPQSRGFDDVVSEVYDVAAAEGNPTLFHPIAVDFPGDTMFIAGTDPHAVDTTETHRLVDAAIALLHRYAAGNQPFFLRMDFPGPHHPFMPPEPWASMYSPESIPPFPTFAESLADKPYAQRRLLAQRGVEGWPWERWQQVNAKYFGFMSYIDWEIGRLLEAVDRLGLSEQLFVAHFADHGGMSGHHGGQFNKGPLMYDDIYHIPLIVRYPPMVRAGTVCSALVRHMDLMPTVLELAKLPIPEGIHASSLLPVLQGTSDRFLDAVFAEYHGEEWGLYSQRMLRTTDYKLVYNPHDRDELYDLVADPHELVNRAEDPAYAAVRSRLEQHLLDWMEATDDPLYLWTRRLYPPRSKEGAPL